MTGGLAYVLRSEADHVLNPEFVQPHEIDERKNPGFAPLLEEHVALTDSPARSRLLARRASLPFVRVQPIHFQGTLEGAWKAVARALEASGETGIFGSPRAPLRSYADRPTGQDSSLRTHIPLYSYARADLSYGL